MLFWLSDQLYYLIGQDNVSDLPKWRRSAELLGMVKFVVFERDGAATPHDFPVVRTRMDISATAVRKRVAEGKSIRYLVPEAVREIIETHRLYKGDSH